MNCLSSDRSQQRNFFGVDIFDVALKDDAASVVSVLRRLHLADSL